MSASNVHSILSSHAGHSCDDYANVLADSTYLTRHTIYFARQHAQMKDLMASQKTKAYRKRIPLWGVAVAWLIYSQLVALGISSGYLVEFGTLIWGALRDIIPSIGRMNSHRYFDDIAAKLHASLMLGSMPFLFLALLATDVESTVEGIRKRRTEVLATLVLVLIASLVLFTGFGNRVGRGSLLSFSLLSCFITGSSAYCYRLAFCVVTKK